MSFRLYRPKPPLDKFVELLWHYEAGEVTAPQRERVLPTGTVELVIRLGVDRNHVYENGRPVSYTGSIVTGTHSRYFVLDKSEQDALVGAHFRPGGAFPFFGLPADELQDAHVSLEDLWGNRATELRERLLHAPTAEERFTLLESALLQAAYRPLVHHPAVFHAMRRLKTEPTAANIEAIADKANLSPRRLGQLFNEQVGVSPKLFCRLQRFQFTLTQLQTRKAVDMTSLAQAAGYYDQSHFVHDFRNFTGMTPTAYHALGPEQANHVPIDSAGA